MPDIKDERIAVYIEKHDEQTIIGSMAREIQRRREDERWIPVGERLPVTGKSVLISDDECGMIEAWWDSVLWMSEHWDDPKQAYHFTHWRKLPTPPAEVTR